MVLHQLKEGSLCRITGQPYYRTLRMQAGKDEIQTPWIRFSAEVVFEERQDIRDAIIEKSAIVNALYKNMRQNPIFKVFYLKHIDGWLTNLGNVKGLEHKAEFAKPVHFRF